jgi:nucleoside-diphosphate-sugar epimerase
VAAAFHLRKPALLKTALRVAESMPVALLTGATGLIGGELCRLLTEQNWGIVALVRGDAPIQSNDGAILASCPYAGLPPKGGDVLRLTGDISHEHCGLDARTRDGLSEQVQMVIHCAASTAFNACDTHYQKTNVSGTAHALALCGNSPFLHISTAYVCGIRDGVVAEVACPAETQFANGYERSKAAAERLVEHSQRPWIIARPSIVVGAVTDGRIRRFDSIYAAFKLMAEGRIKTIPATANASFSFAPVDYVAAALASLAARPENFGSEYIHLSAQQPFSVSDFMAAIGSFGRLGSPKTIAPDRFNHDNLSPTEKRIFDQILKHYLPYFQRNPHFATDNIRKLTGLKSPDVDIAALHRMIGFALETGFIRAAA